MHIIDSSIELITTTASIWLVIEFIKFSWNRGTGRKVAAAAEPQQPIEEPVKPIAFNDSVVPFKRPAPKLTDRDLVKFAKSIGFHGSSKWAYNRKLSAKDRIELRRLWTEHQRPKAG